MGNPGLRSTLFEYVGFDADSARVLEGLGPRLQPHFGQVVEHFYEAIMADSGARAVLHSEAQIERLRLSLREWLKGLFGGVYDEAYFEKRSRIGRVHVKVGLDQRYMLTAMNLVRVDLHSALFATASSDEAALLHGHKEIDQICDIELAIMLETYREDYVHKKTAEAKSLAAMGKLTAGLAHEIRNPLNAAKLQLDVLKKNAADIEGEATRHKIQTRSTLVSDELRRLSMLLEDFLNLARSRRLEPVEFGASQLLYEVLELRRPEIESLGIELHVRDEFGDRLVTGERDRLKQVVNNMVTNAVEAVSERQLPSIEVSSRILNGERWQLRICDNGPSLTPEVAARAFESFFTTKPAGTGLGLIIVKRIVELHGGEASLEPVPEGGTCASFWIPLKP